MFKLLNRRIKDWLRNDAESLDSYSVCNMNQAYLRSFLLAPSYLLFAFMSSTRYESKLWDLKYALEKNVTSNTLRLKFADIKMRYRENTSRHFERVVDTLLKDDSRILMAADKKYEYYTKSAVDWELIRIQPMRYMWNETDQLTFYGVVITGALAWNSILKKGVTSGITHRLQAFTQFKTSFRRLHTMEFLEKDFRIARGYRYLRTIHARIRFPLLVLNVLNFVYLFGGYKDPGRKEDYD